MSLTWIRRFQPRLRAPARIDINFASARRHPSWLGWLLLIAGGLACFATWVEYNDLDARLSQLQARLDKEMRHAERAHVQTQALQREKLPEAELRRAAELAHTLRADALPILADIEASTNDDVTLTGLEISGGKLEIKLAGEARTLDAAFAFSRRLATRPSIAEARLDNYEVKQNTGIEVIAFTLAARGREMP